MNRNRFTFFRSYYEAAETLPDDSRLELYDALLDYVLNGNMRELNGVAKTAFILMKPNLDNSIKQYKNGKEGGRTPKGEETEEETGNRNMDIGIGNKEYPPPNHNPIETQQKPKHNPETSPEVTLTEIAAYFREKGYKSDSVKFYSCKKTYPSFSTEWRTWADEWETRHQGSRVKTDPSEKHDRDIKELAYLAKTYG